MCELQLVADTTVRHMYWYFIDLELIEDFFFYGYFCNITDIYFCQAMILQLKNVKLLRVYSLFLELFLHAFLSFAGNIVIFLSKTLAVLFQSMCWGFFGGVGFFVSFFHFVSEFCFVFVSPEILFQDWLMAVYF